MAAPSEGIRNGGYACLSPDSRARAQKSDRATSLRKVPSPGLQELNLVSIHEAV